MTKQQLIREQIKLTQQQHLQQQQQQLLLPQVARQLPRVVAVDPAGVQGAESQPQLRQQQQQT
jgi:hypothetical protein